MPKLKSSNGAIWDEFSLQHQYQSIRFNAKLALLVIFWLGDSPGFQDNELLFSSLSDLLD